MSYKSSKIEVLKSQTKETGESIAKLNEEHKKTPDDRDIQAELQQKEHIAQVQLAELREMQQLSQNTHEQLVALRIEIGEQQSA